MLVAATEFLRETNVRREEVYFGSYLWRLGNQGDHVWWETCETFTFMAEGEKVCAEEMSDSLTFQHLALESVSLGL